MSASASTVRKALLALVKAPRRAPETKILTLIAAGIAIALLVLPAASAFPVSTTLQDQTVPVADIAVSTTTDELNADGDCSLREAIQAANTNNAVDACPAGSGADTISVLAGTYTLSIGGANENANATGDLDISGALTIIGSSAAATVIDGGGLDRVLHVPTSVAVQISMVTIRNGSADFGGGILNVGTLTIETSTISGNQAGNGGGIYNRDGGLIIKNSTISSNRTTSGGYGGGGILNYSSASGVATADLANSTIAENTAGGSPGFQGRGDAIADAFSPTGSIRVKNSILASPTQGLGEDCYVDTPVLSSLGHNLSSDASCAFGGLGDLNSTNPLLGPLASNAGSTWTHALLAGSPAIDAGSLDCPPPATDQRGMPRPQDGDGNGTASCDIGSYEYRDLPAQPPPAPPLCDNFSDVSPPCKLSELEAGGGTRLGNNSGATGEPVEPNHGVSGSIDSLWYRFTPIADKSITLDTCTGTDFDAVIAVYTGSSVDTLTPVSLSNDPCGAQSSVTFTATFGVTYHVAVDGAQSQVGNFTLTFTEGPALQRPRPTKASRVTSGGRIPAFQRAFEIEGWFPALMLYSTTARF